MMAKEIIVGVILFAFAFAGGFLGGVVRHYNHEANTVNAITGLSRHLVTVEQRQQTDRSNFRAHERSLQDLEARADKLATFELVASEQLLELNERTASPPPMRNRTNETCNHSY